MMVDLYEAEADFTEVGAGITISSRPRSVLYKLGLEDELKPRVRYDRSTCRKSDTSEPFVYHQLDTPGVCLLQKDPSLPNSYLFS